MKKEKLGGLTKKPFFWLLLGLVVLFGVGAAFSQLLFPQRFFPQEDSQPVPKQERELERVSSSGQKTLGFRTPTGPVTPELSISGGENGGGVIALSAVAEPVMAISSYNRSGTAEIAIYRAEKEDLLNYLVHDSEGKQLRQDVDLGQLEYVATTTAEIQSGYKETLVTLPIEELGIWCAQIKFGEITEYAFIVRSDFGAILKEGDNEFIFWGQDLRTKRSLTEGKIRVYSLTDNVSEIAAVDLDRQGIARTGYDPWADIGLIEQGGKLALIPINLRYLNQGNYYRYFQAKQRRAKFYVFSDRPVYQPGDKVYFKSILRDDDDARYTIPRGIAQVKVYRGDEREGSLFEKGYPISPEGTVDGEIEVPTDVRTGSYTLRVDLNPGSDDYWLKSYSYFNIEYFRKPEYTIDISVSQREFIAGDQSSFEITGHYFSGQAITNQRVKYKIYSSSFYDYNYLADIDSRLSDEYRYGYWGGKEIESRTVSFNQHGEAEVGLDLSLPEGEHQTQVFSIEAEFDDGSGNPVFARKNILVYSGEYGIYKDSPVYSGRVGEKMSLPLLLVPRQEAGVANLSLGAKVKRITWVQYQDPNQKYPSYRKEEEDLPDLVATSDREGKAVFSFIPQKEGSYQLTIEGKDSRGNLLQKDFHLWVVSPDQPLYRGERESGLTIQAEKEKYSHQESARLTIGSDLADRDVFLSFDRDRTNRFQVVRVDGLSKTIDVPLVETDIPNIFVKVASFADNFLATAREKIVVSTEPKKLFIEVSPDRERYGPGDVVQVEVQTTDFNGNPVSADTAVWAVDKAIFEIGNRPGDIFETFWQERYDGTQEAHSLEGINVQMAEGGGCFAAGTPVLVGDGKTKAIEEIKAGDVVLTREGEGESGLIKAKVKGVHRQEVSGYLIINQHLRATPNHRLWINGVWKEVGSVQVGEVLTGPENEEVFVSSIEWQKGKFWVYNLEIEKYRTYFAGGVWVHNEKGGVVRSVFEDTAYWNPSLRTDAQGKARVSFILPDNLTTWVIASVGSTRDTAVGQTTSEIVVTRELIVRPILPNILRTDDRVVLSALVQNFTGSDHVFETSLKFDSGEIKSADRFETSIKSDDFAQVYWEVYPHQDNEEAEFTFSARARDDEEIADTVVQKIPVQGFGFWEKRGENGTGPVEFEVELAPDSSREKSEVRLSLAPTLLGTLPSAMRYLVNYPWGCVEQTTSRFVPAVIAKANPDIFGQSIADKDVDDIVRKGVLRLAELQQGYGGWTWWSRGESDLFITAYVAEYLLKAKELGIKVEEDILSRARIFFERAESEGGLTKEDRVARAYGLSLFGASVGIPPADLDTLAPDILALAVITDARNGDQASADYGLQKLLAMMKEQGDGVYWSEGESRFFGSNDASTALAMRAILEAGGDREIAVRAGRYLLRNRKTDYWSNTFATAQVVRAVVDLSRTGQELAPDYDYLVTLDGQVVTQGSVEDYRKPLAEIVVKGTDLQDRSRIAISQSGGQGQIYSTLLINEFHTDKKAKAIDNGLAVKREYVNEKGEDFALGVGDTVVVKVTLSGLTVPENYGVIVDELPSGLIPINPVFKNEQFGREPLYQYGVSDREVTQNGMVLSLRRIKGGIDSYSYKARAVSEGTFIVPPTTAFLMYSPEINGRSAVQTVEIQAESKLIPARVVSKKAKSLWEDYKLLIVVLGGTVFLVGGVAIVIKKRSGPRSPFGKGGLQNPPESPDREPKSFAPFDSDQQEKSGE